MCLNALILQCLSTDCRYCKISNDISTLQFCKFIILANNCSSEI